MSRIRVTMGRLRGQWIETRPGLPYRPLPARLREAFFSHVGSDIEGHHFLDGFAGTGLVGVYALSLGAAYVIFIEKDVRAARLLERNLRRLGLADQTDLRVGDIQRVLTRPPAVPVDWVFLGPPYDFPTARLESVLSRLVQSGWTGADARLAIQRFKKTPPPSTAGWELYGTLTHGDDVIYLFRRMAGKSDRSADGRMGRTATSDGRPELRKSAPIELSVLQVCFRPGVEASTGCRVKPYRPEILLNFQTSERPDCPERYRLP
ncbi:MAG: RsmD family RNA methyltransferase [Acidobacteria bacterium]|nr:RsmD family RNA methyltransferase [Acidobacteriota bacterium]MDW7984061.1 RsmD family RNA methyltransferase [Acidobacteriota bacterium]